MSTNESFLTQQNDREELLRVASVIYGSVVLRCHDQHGRIDYERLAKESIIAAKALIKEVYDDGKNIG